MTSSTVQLYIYDLSRGMARALSPLLVGKQIDGIWHTAIVVYGKEYFFGSHGVESCAPGGTALGPPLQVVDLGVTHIPETLFIEYITELAETGFKGSTYNLFTHNCNNFSEEVAQFLCGKSIPKYILDLPNEVLNSSLGAALPALVSQLEQSARPIVDEEVQAKDSNNSQSGRNN